MIPNLNLKKTKLLTPQHFNNAEISKKNQKL